jgi:hypothetical protein
MAEHHHEICAHPGCNCLAVKGSKYCGPKCESKGDKPEEECSCGHQGCQDSPMFVG